MSTTTPAGPASAGATPSADVPVVGPRQPCPCGSGKRYKVCHGRAARAAASTFVARPFAGLAGEADWVALREIVPAASASVTTGEGAAAHGVEPGTRVTVVTVLPGTVPGLRRPDGEVVVALQTSVSSGDASRDAAAALVRAVALEPGQALEPAGLPGPGPRLQDLLGTETLDVTVHDGFGFWAAGDPDELDPAARAALDEASGAVDPTARVTGLDDVLEGASAAYWTTSAGGRELLRWVLPQEESALLDALGRLAAEHEGGLAVAEGARFLGAFRAQGLLVPVWELAPGTGADGLAAALPAAAERLAAALAATAPLTALERRARAGVVSRQLTLR